MWRGFSYCRLKVLLPHCRSWRHTGSTPTGETRTFGRYSPRICRDSFFKSASQHEWATHGTCFSTLEPSCLPSGSPIGAEAVAYFESVVALFQTLPTYSWLESQGITPSATATYRLTDLISALQTASGGVRCPVNPMTRHFTDQEYLQFTPTLGCSGSTLNSISWYFHLKGSLIDGNFIPISKRTVLSQSWNHFVDIVTPDNPELVPSTCPSSGIVYPPKA